MIFMDMDGVLAVYDPADYVGDPMPFEKRGARYFASRPEDDAAFDLLRRLSELVPKNKLLALSTLSSNAVRNESLGAEHRADKGGWLARACAERGIPCPMLLFASQGRSTKSQAARRYLMRKRLEPSDVLIDDFNGNLADWARAGGTAVKWLNGLNDGGSWPGPTLSAEQVASAAPVIARASAPRRNTKR